MLHKMEDFLKYAGVAGEPLKLALATLEENDYMDPVLLGDETMESLTGPLRLRHGTARAILHHAKNWKRHVRALAGPQ